MEIIYVHWKKKFLQYLLSDLEVTYRCLFWEAIVGAATARHRKQDLHRDIIGPLEEVQEGKEQYFASKLRIFHLNKSPVIKPKKGAIFREKLVTFYWPLRSLWLKNVTCKRTHELHFFCIDSLDSKYYHWFSVGLFLWYRFQSFLRLILGSIWGVWKKF